MASRIPVFVSAPTDLDQDQQLTLEYMHEILRDEGLEDRTLGKSDFATDYPLKEVMLIARHCSGGLILGFNQIQAEQVTYKPGTPKERSQTAARMPTPWNNLEAGMLYGLQVPLMVFREEGIGGGVFDDGVSDVYVHPLPIGAALEPRKEQIKSAVRIWSSKVRDHYRDWP
jgi:hypothetical protein